jgi:DNA-binding MarR family transcriptional regulator
VAHVNRGPGGDGPGRGDVPWPGDVPWLTDEEQSVWRAWLDVSRLLNERLQHQLAEDSDLSLAEYEILVQLSETPEQRLRMSELAARVVNSRSRLTHTVSRLEKRGLVGREVCPEDGRGVLCLLTESGLSVLEMAAPGHVRAVRETLFDPLTAREVQELGSVMDTVRTRLREL